MVLNPTGSPPGLFPAIFNLASNAEITTNATCGEPEPEMYCKLVEHVPGRRIRNSQCRTCNAQSQNPKEQHPITNAIDGTNGWWQSPSIKNGRQFHWVTLTLDLHQIFQVAYVIIKAANSPRPGNWVLERSMDGVEFTPWQYYAISDTECLTRYNITPRLGPPTYKRDDEVICTSYYSRLVPLEHGEIHTSLINGRPSADQLTSELLDFTSARYIRLRLQRIRTLNADLMTLSYRDPKEVDPIVTRRYYYSIKDISVGGMCICYGHAQSCPWDPVAKKLQCVCEHNTCGESCNECCPGYHQEPWQPGTLSDGNTCEKCNCHDKANDCYFNQTVANLKMSMNSHGDFHGGGVCISCTQNTAGVNCEACADGFYRPNKVSPHNENPCVECSCDMKGSLTPACIRDDNHAKPENGLNPGQCLCMEGFAGERCDRCAFGYRDFPLCSRCECSLEGSLNIDPCTECICKENVMGADCDLCKQGFFNLEGSDPEGCTECFCFGVSDVCESSPWSMSQVTYRTDFMAIFSVTNFHYCILAVSTVFLSVTLFPMFSVPFCHCYVKLTSYGGVLSYSVAYDVSVDNVDRSLPSQFDLIIEGNGRTLRQMPPRQLLLTPLREQHVSVELLPQGFVDLHTGQRVDRDELMTALADVAGLRIRGHLNASAEGELRLSTVSLDMVDINSTNTVQARDVEQCECPLGYSGTSCESCSSGFYRLGGILFGGNCLQCECNNHATECDINRVCLDCTHNTTGPHCDQCLHGYYGNPSEGTPEDCQRCACPLTVATNNFSPTCLLEGPGQVTCDRCQQGYTGTKCERCANGYHGNPTVAGQECVVCECNGNVDPWEPGHCDTSSGMCLKCHSHTSGDQCERCEDGYYGDAITAKNCQACACHDKGSYSGVCDLLTGQCTCKPNVVGEKCDQCQVGFHGLLSGQGCRECDCIQSGSVSVACEEDGRCQCIPGVAGDKCDRCHHSYFNYQGSGCTQCECAHTHGNCNVTTGECICPPHTRGEMCDLCEEGHWGHDTVTGCKSCNCSEMGSYATQCGITNGQCQCRSDFAGQNCDRCVMGYRGYPECTVCNCNINGTREEFCDEALGVCSCEAPGNCVCKDNVVGGGCDECKKGTLGLSVSNPAGCSPCFCFGVSSDCEELGGMVRVPITLGSDPELLRVVSQSDLQGSVVGVYYRNPDMLLDTRDMETPSLAGPYYWRLPKHYQGNKLLSYGGKLSYVVAFYAMDGAGLANYEPQVLMRGGHLGKQVIYIDMPAPDNGVTTRQDVPLTEHKWKYFNSVSEKAVSHSDFMAVLSHIEYITIKASYGTGLQQSRISNITMDTALEAEQGLEDMELASLIEICECPAGYAGLSCQECAPGYYRQPVTELNKRGKRPLIQPCVPCRCNNHSQACDLDTGECLGCQHNTAGEHCSVCSSGYYGDVKGSVRDCSLCACPLKENSFSPTCALEGVVGDFRCNACKPGYEGRYCERCSVGYYGNPSGPGGRCEACQCSTAGSLHPACDSLTGQCECKAGVRGRLCDQCEARHVLDGDQCVLCDDECTRVLLDDLDAVECSFLSVNLTGVILSPYSTLVNLENDTQETLMSSYRSPDYHLTRDEEDMTNLTQDIDGLLQKAMGVSADGEEVARSTENSVTQGAELLEYINTIQTAIQVEVTVVYCILTLLCYVNCRAAEALLQRVQKHLQEPQGVIESQTLNISSSLTQHQQQLVDAQALLNTARENNNHTHTLLGSINTNLPQYQVRTLTLFKQNVGRLNQMAETQLEETQDILADAVNLAEDMSTVTSQLEGAKEQLEQWNPMLRKHVDALVMELRKQEALELVYKAEDHAQELSKKAQALQSSLAEVMNTTLKATSAAHANSNIRVNIQPAEEMANRAILTAAMALNMVSRHDISITNLSYLLSLSARTAESKLNEAESRTERLYDRLKPLKTLRENLSRNLSEIREMINQARKQAASIKVSVLADKDCVRAYKPEMSSSNFNTLTMTVKTSEPDNLLFYMGSSSSVDFMAVEMHRGKVGFLWDAGSGHAKLEYPDIQINNNKWHRINATRFGRHGTLSVHQLESDPLPAVKTTSPRSATVLDVNKFTLIFVGGLGRQIKTSSAVKMTQFKGCMGEASLNEKNIGLWNYAEREGQCRGCFMSPQTEETSFHFDGSGYSVVEKPLRSTSTSIVLLFKTLSPNGLLLYLASNATRDFLSIELVEGQVHLTFELGSGPLTLSSNKAYNTGSWYKITLQRNKRKGHTYISVMAADNSSDKEIIEAESPGSASDLNRSDLDPIYIGGLPMSRPIRRQVVARSYVGCIKNMEIARSNFDLLRDSYGVKKGCVLEPIRSVSVLREGYVELPSMSLGSQGELLASFSTRNHTGIILAGFSKAGTRKRRQPILAVMLVSGHLEVHVNMVEGGSVHKVVVKSRSGSFSDGQEHSVILQRNRKTMTVLVDEDHQETVRLSSEKASLTFSSLYMGGLPPEEGVGLLRTTSSFYGCIRNLALDFLDFSFIVLWSLCVSLQCASMDNSTSLPEANQFGISRHSHKVLNINPNTVRRSFSLELSVRTFTQSGLIYYMAHANQMDYATLQLLGGRLFFTCDKGSGPATASFPVPVNDGQWHTVKTDFNKKSVVISVDSQASAPVLAKGNTLDVENKLYLGGLPHTYTAKKIGNVTHSLAGCIQKVILNSVELDTQSPVSEHSTAHCFTAAQDGTFFSGSGYAALMKEGYKVGSDVTVALEFRSTAPDGVILGVSSAKVDAIGLELASGQAVFHVNNGAGRVSATSRLGRWLCDGRWHTLLAKKTKNALSLSVDGVTVLTDNPHPQSTSAETKDPIYVGGFPVGVKQNCLTSRSSFRGCMRNIRLIKGHVIDILDFSTAFTLQGVSPHSCPAT
uniref:Laminin, alpha 1 n=1 Tax=Oncorhynchus tshawytscha TaxID=74940 RepID=A0A8C8HC76_ONCTS